jgi:hypothetical protein
MRSRVERNVIILEKAGYLIPFILSSSICDGQRKLRYHKKKAKCRLPREVPKEKALGEPIARHEEVTPTPKSSSSRHASPDCGLAYVIGNPKFGLLKIGIQ